MALPQRPLTFCSFKLIKYTIVNVYCRLYSTIFDEFFYNSLLMSFLRSRGPSNILKILLFLKSWLSFAVFEL
jgi:hypothetical protein